MAAYNGYRCDKCGKVIDKEQMTRRTVRFEGAIANGEYHEDLCTECVVIPQGTTLHPLRRRKPRDAEPASS